MTDQKSAEDIFQMTPVELADEAIRLKLFPYPDANSIRIALAVEYVKNNIASNELVWYVRSPRFADVMQESSGRDDLELTLSPRLAIVAELERFAATSKASGNERRAASAMSAASDISTYKGSWNEDQFAIGEPSYSVLHSKFVKGMISDVCRTGSSNAVIAAEQVAVDPNAVAHSLNSATGISLPRCTSIVQYAKLQKLSDIDIFSASSIGSKYLQEVEKILIKYRQSFSREISESEESEWSNALESRLFGCPAEAPEGSQQPIQRWIVVVNPDSRRLIRVVFLNNGPSVNASESAAQAFGAIGFLVNSTPFKDGGKGDYCVVAAKIGSGFAVRKVAFLRIAIAQEFPFRALTAILNTSALSTLSKEATLRGMTLKSHGLFIGDVAISAPNGSYGKISELIGSEISLDQTRLVFSNDHSIILPIPEMEAAGVDAMQNMIPTSSKNSNYIANFEHEQTESKISIEYEVRMNHLTKQMFFLLIDAFHKSSSTVAKQQSEVWIYSRNFRTVTSSSKTQHMRKISLHQKFFPEIGIRSSVSKEIKMNNLPRDVGPAKVRRSRNRWTMMKGQIKIDATIVENMIISNYKSQPTIFQTYEIEAETENKSDLPMLNNVAIWILHTIYSTPILFTLPDRTSVFDKVNQRLMTSSSKLASLKIYAESTKAEPGILGVLADGLLTRPRNLKRHDLTFQGLGFGYTVSIKADGETRLLYVDMSTGIWLLFAPSTAELIVDKESVSESTLRNLDGLILVGEKIPPQNRNSHLDTSIVFVPFDVLAPPFAKDPISMYSSPIDSGLPESVQSIDVKMSNDMATSTNYMERIAFFKSASSALNSLVSNSTSPQNLIVIMKPFVDCGNNRDSLARAVRTVMRTPVSFETDGLIFTPIHSPQLIPQHRSKMLTPTTPSVCKWKPRENLTIDLAVSFTSNDDQSVTANVFTIDSSRKLSLFKPVSEGHAFIDFSDEFFSTLLEGSIVEFYPKFDSENFDKVQFVPQRIRIDKEFPNGTEVAMDVWMDIQSPIPISTLYGTDFNLLRQQMNEAKRRVLRTVLSRQHAHDHVLVVDLGSGRGGDLTKIFGVGGVKGVIWVEPNEDSIKELWKRAKPLGISSNDIILTTAQDYETIGNVTARKAREIGATAIVVTMMLSLSFFHAPDGKDLIDLHKTLISISQAVPNTNVSFVFVTIEDGITRNLLKENNGAVVLGPASLRVTSNGAIATHIDGTIVDDYIEYPTDLSSLSQIIQIEYVERVPHGIVPATSLQTLNKDQSITTIKQLLYLTENEAVFLNLFVAGNGIVKQTMGDDRIILPKFSPIYSTFDDYPYLRWFPNISSDKMFQQLIQDVPNLKIVKQSSKGREVLIRTWPENHLNSDALSDLFMENVRIQCKFQQFPTPFEVWDKIRTTTSSHMLDNISSQRNNIYSLTKQCNTFNPMIMVWIISKTLNNIDDAKILDPSTGWGDRIIGTYAANVSGISKVSTYHGFDPNPDLVPGHAAIVQKLGAIHPSLQIITNGAPFEYAPLEHNFYDLVFTSPPFYNLEQYTTTEINSKGQSIASVTTYDEWLNTFYQKYLDNMFRFTKNGGHFGLYVSDFVINKIQYPLVKDTKRLVATIMKSAIPWIAENDPIFVPEELGFVMTSKTSSNPDSERPILLWKKPILELSPTTLEIIVSPQSTSSHKNVSWFEFVEFRIPPAPKSVMDSIHAKRKIATNLIVFDEIDTVLGTAKSRLDHIPNASLLLRKFQPLSNAPTDASKLYGAQIATNAWLKMWEICQFLKLETYESVRMFANAELPGGFISATNHYLCTHNVSEFQWIGSSLFPKEDMSMLGDSFGLYANNQDKWLMSADFPGDLMDTAQVIELSKRALSFFKEDGRGINLYTSDAGAPTDADPNRQELLLAKLHLGQVIVGLMSLAAGGNFVVKTFTFNYRFSIDLISILSTMFLEFYIVKPESSRATNSEIYLVGKSYIRSIVDQDAIIQILLNKHQNFDVSKPLISSLPTTKSGTMASLKEAANQLFIQRQTMLLNKIVDGSAIPPTSEQSKRIRQDWFTKFGVTSLNTCTLSKHLKVNVSKK